LLIGIFIVAIVRQFPTVVVEWVQGKITHYTNKWENTMDNLEKRSIHTWQLYLLWTLKYINFKKAILTTAYGLLGVILVYNLTAITNDAMAPVEVWIESALGPGIARIQTKLQDGINEVIYDVQGELNVILQESILNTLAPANGTLSEILIEKDRVLDKFNNITNEVSDIPVIGLPLVNALSCMLPTAAFGIIDTAITLMIEFMQELMNARINIPALSFPDMSVIAISATNIVVTKSVQVIQDSLRTYLIIFIILSTAFGILVTQGLIFVGLRRIAMRIKKQRRLTRMKSQQNM